MALAVVALGAGYFMGYEPPPKPEGPGAALRAYQRARIEALGACARHGYATQWGDVAPDSRVALECMGLSTQPCTSYAVPVVREEPNHGPRI